MNSFKITTSLLFVLTTNQLLLAQNPLSTKADIVRVDEDNFVEIDVLDNDNIEDKTNIIIEIVTKPKLGKVEIVGQDIIYTPGANVNGVDKFDYKVDNGLSTGTAQVRVDINPVNDAPDGLSLSKNKINENAPAGSIVGRLIVDDADKDDTFKFGLAKENRSDFSLDGSNILTKRPFDYESKKLHSISVQVTDSGNEKMVGEIEVLIDDVNEPPIHLAKSQLKFNHAENQGKVVGKIRAEDPDVKQSAVKFKLDKSLDENHFKITRSGDIVFLRAPDYEMPIDKDKNNKYEISYKIIDSKDSKLFISGGAIITVEDAIETEVIALDKRKYIAWSVDHQPYHILLEDAVKNYLSLKGMNQDNDESMVKEMEPTDQIIVVQRKGNKEEIHQIWYGNGLDFSIIDRENVDWVFSQDIQKVLISKDDYLTSESETVFHESESDRLMAGYGTSFSLWHANNFRMTLSSFSMRSNLLQYASNMRVGNPLIGLPGLLSGSSELGVATQRSEFGFRVPFSFDFGSGSYNGIDVVSSDYLGLYARGNIDNIFETKTSFHGLIGFTFYPPSSGNRLDSPVDISSEPISNSDHWADVLDNTENINILDSYALAATTVNVPVRFLSLGRITASPGLHYLKIAHRLKDNRQVAIDNNQELYERTFYDQSLNLSSGTPEWNYQSLNDEGNSYTRLSSFYIRFDAVGKIGQKPKFIERISLLDFIQVSKVPFYEVSVQFISGLNSLTKLNLNITDEFGVSLTSLSKNSELKGNWMPESKFWFGLNYKANF